MSSTNSELATTSLRVAVIGYGLAGAVFHAPLIASTPGMVVAAIVTNHPERRERAQRNFPHATILSTAQDLWHDPSRCDLVVVAAPNRAHVSLGLAAMNAGLPVVIDKPFAPSLASAMQLIAASKTTGKLLTVFQNRRWDNDFLMVRQLIAADHGHHLDLHVLPHSFPTRRSSDLSWREFPAAEEAGGLLFDLGSHLIDQALQLFGPPVSVYAEVEKQRPGAQVDDDTFVALSFANGLHAHLWMSLVARIPGPRFRINGLRGTYEKWGIDPQEDALQSGMRPGDPHWGLEPRERWGHISADVNGVHIDGSLETPPGAYERFYTLLRDALLTGGPPPVDPADAVASLRIIEAAQQSARSRTIVEL